MFTIGLIGQVYVDSTHSSVAYRDDGRDVVNPI